MDVQVQGIPSGCDTIEPGMLPLVELGSEHIEQIIATVPGGARNIQDIYPLAPMQEGMLFHHLVDPSGDTFVVVTLLEFQSGQQLSAFIEALQRVIARHDILRSAVLWEHLSQPVQVVYRQADLPVEELEREQFPDPERRLRERMRPDCLRIDLRRAPLMRLQVIRHSSDGKAFALLQMHHMVCDAQSLGVLIAEVKAYLKGTAHQLPQPRPYRAHVEQVLAQSRTHDAEAFFRRKLGDVDEATAPYGVLPVHGQAAGAEVARRELDPALALRLRGLARRQRVNAAALFHAAWALVTAQTSARDDIVFGTVVFGRLQMSGGTQQRVGMFNNTLPLRMRLLDLTARELVSQVHRELLESLYYEQTPLVIAQRCSGVAPSAPLFTAVLNFRHGARDPESEWNDPDCGIRELGSQAWSNYPITLAVDDRQDGFVLTALTDPRIDPLRMVTYLATSLERLANALDETPDMPALGLSILPDSERRQVNGSLDVAPTTPSQEKLIHELFQEQAHLRPDAVAVTCGRGALTYRELNVKANKLARRLRAEGIGPEQLVGLCLERSLQLVVGLLAILKAGGAYLPLDPTYPPERLAYMLEDATPTVLLTQEGLRARLPETRAKIITVDGRWDEVAQADPDIPDSRSAAQAARQLAYVMYTSGSTGKPKAVMVEHANVTRLFSETHPWFEFNERDVWTMFHSFAFDFSVWELWGALLYGGRVVVVPHLKARSPQEFYRLLCEEGVTVLNQTPSAFAQLSEAQGQESHSLRQVVFGGEALAPRMLRPWVERNGVERPRLVNMYGITETTVHVTYCPLGREQIDLDQGSPIGTPIPDLRIYLLDRRRQPVPIGVAGEIYVSGAGVAPGYLNRPDLTAERFLADPHRGTGTARMYKTGDLGRWRDDGTLEYLGRNDHQVKIRGHRIELGEIEAQIARHEQVKDVVVIAREDIPGNRRLVAYVVAVGSARAEPISSDASGSLIPQLRESLKGVLPDYMIPSAWMTLTHLPLTSNGKLDRKALPAPEGRPEDMGEYVAPRTEVERALAAIWAQVLRVEEVGIHDDFFELGGHSLLGMKLVARIAQRFNVRLSAASVFQYPSVALQAEAVQSTMVSESVETQFRHRPDPRRAPLTFAQLAWWRLYRLGEQTSWRRVALALTLRGQLDLDALRKSLEEMVRRHEALRTRIVAPDGEPLQIIDEPRDCPLRLDDLTAVEMAAREGEVQRRMEEFLLEPVDVALGPLFAVLLWKLEEHQHVLILAMDHIVSDLSSLDVLQRELFEAYGRTVRNQTTSGSAVRAQLGDYAFWQRHSQGPLIERRAADCQERLAGCGRLRFPQDRSPQRGWGSLTFRLDEAATAKLREWCRARQTSLAMGALTAYAALVLRWCGVSETVIQYQSDGREDPRTEKIVGLFSSRIYLRVKLLEEDRGVDLLSRIRQEYVRASECADFSFLESQVPPPEFTRNTVFNWTPQGSSDDDGGGSGAPGELLAVEALPPVFPWLKDLEWDNEPLIQLYPEGAEMAGRLYFQLSCCSEAQMQGFARNLVSLMRLLIGQQDLPVKRFPLAV